MWWARCYFQETNRVKNLPDVKEEMETRENELLKAERNAASQNSRKEGFTKQYSNR